MTITRNGENIQLTDYEVEKAYREQESYYRTLDVMNRSVDMGHIELDEEDCQVIANLIDDSLSDNERYYEAYWQSIESLIEDYVKENEGVN